METKEPKTKEENEKVKAEPTNKDQKDKKDETTNPHEKGSCCGGCGG